MAEVATCDEPPVIEVKNLVKEFRLGALEGLRRLVKRLVSRERDTSRRQFRALDDVSFSIKRGEVVGIIGHNGAGKSTLLKLLCNISSPTSGSLQVRGRIAPMIEVGAGFVPDLTGRENVYLNGAILGLSKDEIDRKFDEIVEFAELSDFIDTPVKRYSSGMLVKLAFAVATSVESEILIVDEVLAVGDLAFQRKCFDRMDTLIKREGRTVLLVSHNIRQVERVCSRVLFMEHGRLRQSGPAREVCNAFYEYSDQRIVAQADAARKRVVATTGEVEITDFQLLGPDGLPATEALYLADLTVRFALQVHKPLPKPLFVLGLHTTDFVNVSTTTSFETYRSRILEVGHHELTVKLRNCPLTPGAYSFRLSIDIDQPIRNIFYSDGLSHFNVRSPDLQRTGSELEGFFMLNAEWSELNGLATPTRPETRD